MDLEFELLGKEQALFLIATSRRVVQETLTLEEGWELCLLDVCSAFPVRSLEREELSHLR